MRISTHVWCPLALSLLAGSAVSAHDGLAHHGPTYSIAEPIQRQAETPRLTLQVMDHDTGEPIPARFTIRIDQQPYVPAGLGRHGLRFESIHQGKRQRFVATYARGSGAVEIPLPADTTRGVVVVTRGFDYIPVEARFAVRSQEATTKVRLRQWHRLAEQGWKAADEHVHYDRLDPQHDSDWLTMLAADGLTQAHFLVLRGGNLDGVWAQQFAYGKSGEARDGVRLIRPGEEYRDGQQGHINLLGIEQVIQPISTGGIGRPSTRYSYPPLHDVFLRARELGGIGGPAHGAKLSRSPTAIVDTVLGAVDFFEIGNTHLTKTDVWYRLMNCGFIVPPAAGTDLPNFPFRDAWQPFLGEIRMYVRVGEQTDFAAWKQAVARSETFVTSGPMIQIQVNGVGPGGTVQLQKEGGEVRIQAELSSPRPLQQFTLVHNGHDLPAPIVRSHEQGIHRWHIERTLKLNRSGWIAVRGAGQLKQALLSHTKIEQNTFAHTAAVRVQLGDEPITSSQDARFLLSHLAQQQEYYRTQAQHEKAEHRQRFMELFDGAIEKLERQVVQ